MQNAEFIQGLLTFIEQSPTPFHAVKNMAAKLEEAGFQRLSEKDAWSFKQKPDGERYYLTRNDSSIIAFQLNQSPLEHGINMIGAHTDSPCLKVKPNPEIKQGEYLQLGVEVYGGVLLNSWFDRDLSLAGRVSYLNENRHIQHQLIDWKKAIASIPSLAIHLDSTANENKTINKQTDLPPVLMRLPKEEVTLKKLLLQHINNENKNQDAVDILDYELCFYDIQKPAITGFHDEFISSARLDNLLSCYTGLMALIHNKGKQNALLVCNDHEEVGSTSASGANGNFLKSVLSRIAKTNEDMARICASSMMISVDNAHALHPNFPQKHDNNHGPVINQGPVVKTNANQRYASNSETGAIFRQLCALAKVPVQSFVVRSDMACGSTIGPVTSAELGVRTVDVGLPTFAMHSIRELAGKQDTFHLYSVLHKYFE